jgi:hypothetical protein
VAKTKPKKRADDSCRTATALIGVYLAGSLQARDHFALEQHLSSCPDCVAFLRTYKKTIDATRTFLRLQAFEPVSRRLKFRPRQSHSLTPAIF